MRQPASPRLHLLTPLIFASIVLAALPAGAQTVVTPDNLQGWLIGPFGTAPPADFVDGPDMPPFGTGSYFTEIVDPASKIILARTDLHDQPLSALTALSFWTYIDPAATNVNNWYVNLYLDADGDGAYESRLDFVPPSGDVTPGVWQFWDAFAGTWSSSGGPVTLADFLIANPNARINAFDDPLGGALRWNMGDTASSYVGFIGNLDGIRIAVDTVGDTTWDLELVPAPTVVAIEVPAISTLGLQALIAAFGGLSLLTIRRRAG